MRSIGVLLRDGGRRPPMPSSLKGEGFNFVIAQIARTQQTLLVFIICDSPALAGRGGEQRGAARSPTTPCPCRCRLFRWRGAALRPARRRPTTAPCAAPA